MHAGSKITTNDETEFLAALRLLGSERKLILGRREGNRVHPMAEIRKMATIGGFQFGMAEFDYLCRRGSGRYSTDDESIYIWAIDYEKRSPGATWFVVYDCEHTPDTIY